MASVFDSITESVNSPRWPMPGRLSGGLTGWLMSRRLVTGQLASREFASHRLAWLCLSLGVWAAATGGPETPGRLALAAPPAEPAVADAKAANIKAPKSVIRLDGLLKTKPSELELLAGKTIRTHETVLILGTPIEELVAQSQAAGLWGLPQWRDPAAAMAGSAAADPDPFTEHWGDRLLIEVEWVVKGQTVRVRGEDLVHDVAEGRPLRRTGWIYQGLTAEDEAEFLLTLKGLAASAVYGAYVLYPKAYLDDSYRPGPLHYVGRPEALPPSDDPNRQGIAATLVLTPVSETELVDRDIADATDPDSRAFHQTLRPLAQGIDAAKLALRRQAMPAREAALKAGLELASKAPGDPSALRAAEHKARAALAEVRALQQRVRAGYMTLEVAYGQRDLQKLAALPDRVQQTLARFGQNPAKAGAVGAAKSPEAAIVALLSAARDLDPNDLDAPRWADRLGGTEDWKRQAVIDYRLFEAHSAATPYSLEELARRPAELAGYLKAPAQWKQRAITEFENLAAVGQQQQRAYELEAQLETRLAELAAAGTPPGDHRQALDRLAAQRAIHAQRAEYHRAEVKRRRQTFQLSLEEARNQALREAGQPLGPLARELVDHAQLRIREATRRQTACQARVVAAEAYVAWLDLPAPARPAAQADLDAKRQAAVVAGQWHQVTVWDETLDELKWKLQKALDDDAIAALTKRIAEVEAQRQALAEQLSAAGQMP